MAKEIPVIEPEEIISGDYIQWRKNEDTERTIADSWVLSYAIVMAGQNIEIQCTDNGDKTHLATITVAVSEKLKAGTYSWQSYTTKGTERYFVDSGTLSVKPNFAALDGGHDGRSYWQRTLDNIEAVIEERATKDQSSYTVNGRQLSRTSIPDLIMLHDKAKAMVVSERKAENIRKGIGGSNNIYTRFN